jgi:vancomycin resistance protein YoaR
VTGLAHSLRPAVYTDPIAETNRLQWPSKLLLWVSGLFALFILLNTASYFVFQSVTMPGTNLYGKNYSFTPYGQLDQDVNERLKNQTITVVYGDKSAEFTYSQLGLTFDSQRTFEFADQRTIWNIPLVQLMFNGSAQITPSYQVDQAALESSLSNLIAEVDLPAKDARLVFPDSVEGEVKVTDSVAGKEMNTKVAASQFLEKIKTLDYSATSLELTDRYVAPEVSKQELEDKVALAKSLLKQPIVVTGADGKEVTKILPQTFIHLLGNDKDKLAADEQSLKQYINEELALYFYSESVARRINSGTLTAAGKDGVGLDQDHAYTALSEALVNPNKRQVSLKTKPIEAPVVVDGVYPKTDEGLATLLRDFEDSHYGEYNLIVRSLKDDRLGATQDATQIIIPASTYKAFIAYAALKSVENGEMTLDTMTPHGTLRDCMYEMIHVSTDHCAISIQDHMGWDKVDKYIHDAGFVDTIINNEGFGGEKYTSALDEYRLLRGLHDGTLLNKEHTNYLLDLMKNQMWRNGIPAGSAPATVANKVGFYALRENDVGIVYAPKGDYIIVAMSNRGSFGDISVLARQVYQFFGN